MINFPATAETKEASLGETNAVFIGRSLRHSLCLFLPLPGFMPQSVGLVASSPAAASSYGCFVILIGSYVWCTWTFHRKVRNR